jgi:hypothetical protein
MYLNTKGISVPAKREKKPHGPAMVLPPGATSPRRHEQSFFAGSMMMLTVSLDGPKDGTIEEMFPSTSEWPQGLTISAGHLNQNEKFIIDQDLTDKLHFEFAGATSYLPGAFRFFFTVPPKSPASFRINAVWQHPTLGEIPAATLPIVDVVQPRTAIDTNLVGDSYISFTQTLDYARCGPRVVSIADSLVRHGYTGAKGLQTAQVEAERVGEWDKALQFLDINYLSNGKAALIFASDSMTTEEVQEEFSRVRLRLLAREPETRRYPKPGMIY